MLAMLTPLWSSCGGWSVLAAAMYLETFTACATADSLDCNDAGEVYLSCILAGSWVWLMRKRRVLLMQAHPSLQRAPL